MKAVIKSVSTEIFENILPYLGVEKTVSMEEKNTEQENTGENVE